MSEGVLVMDKPQGLTSHDVVAAARRVLGQPRIGHTGTLDPLATGVLPLACGRATRLVRFLAGADKEYDAAIRLGLATDTYDVSGREVRRSEARPPRDEIARTLQTLAGEYLQAPPPFSAKKIAGRRAYDLARAEVAVQPAPVAVRVERLELVEVGPDVVLVRITCSAGFYVRTLVHELGAKLGIGACLKGLRRTRSGEFALADAVPFDVLMAEPARAAARIVPMGRLLPDLPALTLTEAGLELAAHGRIVPPVELRGTAPGSAEWIRLIRPDGALIALARRAGPPGSLHPSIVLI